jgi:hypothetical protein
VDVRLQKKLFLLPLMLCKGIPKVCLVTTLEGRKESEMPKKVPTGKEAKKIKKGGR